jgi:hypothetical protein
MVSEILVWALVLKNDPHRVVDIYNTELVCRQDLREVRKMEPHQQWVCMVRRSMERPTDEGRAR